MSRWGGGVCACVCGVSLHVHTSNIDLNIKKREQSIIKVKRKKYWSVSIGLPAL